MATSIDRRIKRSHLQEMKRSGKKKKKIVLFQMLWQRAQPEVGDLQVAGLVEEEILRLQIPW